MSDVDSLLRERLGAAAAFDVDADPQLVREGVARRQRRIRRRRRGTVVVAALAVAGLAAGVVGLASRDSGEDVAVRAGDASNAPSGDAPAAGDAPSFRTASGWDAVRSDAATTAANVALGPASRAGSVPWDTVSRLDEGDVVLFVMFSPAGADSGFPPQQLPLSLAAAQPGGLEGQPDNVYAERLTAEVDGWIVDVVAFYGGGSPPSAATRAAAQAELERLAVPARTASRESAAATSDACQPANLVAQVTLDGALDGRISVRNVGPAACTLSGQAAVEPRDTNATVLPSTTASADPAWRRAAAVAPEGWPTVHVAPGAEAQAVLQVRNWCGAALNRLFFLIRLPGQADRIGGEAPSVEVPPQCTDPQAPMQLAVGPFEPPRTAG